MKIMRLVQEVKTDDATYPIGSVMKVFGTGHSKEWVETVVDGELVGEMVEGAEWVEGSIKVPGMMLSGLITVPKTWLEEAPDELVNANICQFCGSSSEAGYGARGPTCAKCWTERAIGGR